MASIEKIENVIRRAGFRPLQRNSWYGIVDERHQYYTPGRDASVCDILTNLAGGWLCASVLRAVEDDAPPSRIARISAIGLPACGLAALIATLVPPLWPELTWL